MALHTPEAPSTGPAPGVEAGVIEDARRRQYRHRIAWTLSLAVIVAGLIVVLGGSGGSNGALSNADVLAQIEHALAAKPGTIVVQRTRTLSFPRDTTNGEKDPAVVDEVIETPIRGAQSYLFADNTRWPGSPSYYGVVNGVAMMSLRSPDEIYASSVWGPYITRGSRPGTFVYRHPRETFMGTSYPQEEFFGSLPSKPLTLTTAQAHAVLTGADTIIGGKRVAVNYAGYARTVFDAPDDAKRLAEAKTGASVVVPTLRFPVNSVWVFLKEHELKVVDRTTDDGRRAIELAGPTKLRVGTYFDRGYSMKLWVDARTYAPIKLVTRQAKAHDVPESSGGTVTWLEYRVLPITPRSERLLSPLSLHPTARFDRDRSDFINATYQQFNLYGVISGPYSAG